MIYTWWKISEALDAYNSYKGDAPFLLAWQRGFEHGSEPLSVSASVVASVVAIVIILTIGSHLLRDLLSKRQQDLRTLLWQATRLLSPPAPAAGAFDPTDLRELGKAVTTASFSLRDSLDKSSKEITKAVDTGPGSKLGEVFDAWTKAAGELNKLGQQLQGTQATAAMLATAQQKLSDAANGIGTQTERLLAALADERRIVTQEAHAHRQLADHVRQSTENLEKALAGLSVDTEFLNGLVLRIDAVVNRMES